MTINSTLGPNGYEVSIPAPVSGGGISPSMLCAAIGDSRFANSIQDQSTATQQRISWSNQGVLSWLHFLTFQRMYMPPLYDVAVSGATTAAIASTQLAAVLALSPRPKICFVNGGTNSFSASPTNAQVTQSLADITGAAVALRAAGIEPIIETDTPRTVASWTSAAQKCSINYNRALRTWCRDNGYRLADSEALFCAAGGDPVTGYNVADGIHQAQTGAIVRAKALADAVSPLLPTSYTSNTGHPLDVYDATSNPRGNLLAVGLMTGTGGANSGTGASGTGPTGWTNQVVSGTMTAAISKESPRSDGLLGDRAQVAISSVTVPGVHRLAPTGGISTLTNFAAGDQIVCEVDLEITALSGTVDYVHLYAFDYDGSNIGSSSVAMKNTFSTGLNPMPALPLLTNTGSGNLFASLKGRLRTSPVIIGQDITSTTLHFRIETGIAAGAACTHKVGDATARKVS